MWKTGTLIFAFLDVWLAQKQQRRVLDLVPPSLSPSLPLSLSRPSSPPALEPLILDSNSPSSSRPLCLALNLSLLELSAFRLPAKSCSVRSSSSSPPFPSFLSTSTILFQHSSTSSRLSSSPLSPTHSLYQQHLRLCHQTILFNNVCRRRQARRQEGRLQEGCWHQRLLRGKFLISTRLVFGATS